METKIIIGRKDKADLPELGLKNIAVKMDTGAYTSAIHCGSIEAKEIAGKKVLFFTLLDPSHLHYNNKEHSSENFVERKIKNSFGTSETRYVIKTWIKLFAEMHIIELSLSDRGEMKFPILVGRRFLMGKFIVDSSKYDLSFKEARNNKNNKL